MKGGTPLPKQQILIVGLPNVGKAKEHRDVLRKKTLGKTHDFKQTTHEQKIKVDGLIPQVDVWDVPGINQNNVLTRLLRARCLAEQLDAFYPGEPLLATLSFADDWSVLNAASILAASVVKRLSARTDDFTLEQFAAELPAAGPLPSSASSSSG